MTRHIALFSGGHDPLAATHYAMEQGDANEVLHIDTGIDEAEEARRFAQVEAEHQQRKSYRRREQAREGATK